MALPQTQGCPTPHHLTTTGTARFDYKIACQPELWEPMRSQVCGNSSPVGPCCGKCVLAQQGALQHRRQRLFLEELVKTSFDEQFLCKAIVPGMINVSVPQLGWVYRPGDRSTLMQWVSPAGLGALAHPQCLPPQVAQCCSGLQQEACQSRALPAIGLCKSPHDD